MTRIDGTRYAGHWDLMAKLARWLLDQRAGRYAALVEAGKMTAEDAEVDETARRAIDADWQAISTRKSRDPGVRDCPVGWKIHTLASAVATLTARSRTPDEIDLRDATHHLFSMYRSGHVGLVLREYMARRNERVPIDVGGLEKVSQQIGEQPCS